MNENYVKLNTNEMNVLLTGLQLLNHNDEKNVEQLNEVSVSALYNKLYSIREL
jgi:hypothetical protein